MYVRCDGTQAGLGRRRRAHAARRCQGGGHPGPLRSRQRQDAGPCHAEAARDPDPVLRGGGRARRRGEPRPRADAPADRRGRGPAVARTAAAPRPTCCGWTRRIGTSAAAGGWTEKTRRPPCPRPTCRPPSSRCWSRRATRPRSAAAAPASRMPSPSCWCGAASRRRRCGRCASARCSARSTSRSSG